MKLNKEQLKAVCHQKGPLLIIAGAGTGKTSVITKRIEWLISQKKVSPSQILALTFTEKAAAEMLARLDVVMPLGYEEPWIGTFHSFCDRILREEGLEIGLSPDYQILSQAQSWIFFKKHLFDFDFSYYRPLGNPTKFISAILKFFSRVADEDVSAEDFLTWAKKLQLNSKLKIRSVAKAMERRRQNSKLYEKEEIEKLVELAKAYKKYQELKIAENFLDFGDLISWTLKLFRKRPAILKKYENQFQHILVDEFQDTNWAQLQLIKLLAPAKKNPNLVVVGDDFQSIYKWRGAAVSNILDFKKHYPKAKTIILNKNYRSTQPLLDLTTSMVRRNEPETLEHRLKIDKSLSAQRRLKIVPQIFELATCEEEADFVVEKILEVAAKGDYTYKDFAILARANNHLDPFVAGLKRNGIPYQLLGNRGLFDQEEVKELIYFLKVVVNPNDSQSLFQLMHASPFSLKREEIFNLLVKSREAGTSLWDFLKEEKENPPISNLINQIRFAQDKAFEQPVSKILFDFIQETSLVRKFLEEESLKNQLKIKNINLFFNLIKEFESKNKDASLVDFVDYLDLLIEAGENPAQAEIEDIDTVNLLTVHSAKGLEFGIVFIVNCVADRFPTRRRGDLIEFPESLVKETLPFGDSHLQEERRLFYVGCTRAKDYLFLTYSTDYGGVRQRKPSIFLKEIGMEIQKPKGLARQLSWLEEVRKIPSPRPQRIVSGRLELPFISFSQLDTFKTCPLKYKYRYILKVPSRPHHALTFGQTIHETLRDFHLFELKGQTPDLQTFLSLYKERFIPAGYGSAEHQKRRFIQGKKLLKKYFVSHKDHFVGQPLFLEKKFRLMVGKIPLIGKIDRIDKLGGRFELIDYKTGSVREQKEVDKDTQLTIYAIAASWALHIDPEILSLYFIEEDKKFQTSRTIDQLKERYEWIQENIEAIKKSKFEAKPGYPFPCTYCEYNLICPFAKRV